MTRAELARQLTSQLAPYGILIAPNPSTAAVAPMVVIGSASPYRAPDPMCWTQTWELVCVVGRMDDLNVDELADELADTLCHRINLDGIVNHGVGPAPALQTIGDVDYLTFRVVLTDYQVGTGREAF